MWKDPILKIWRLYHSFNAEHALVEMERHKRVVNINFENEDCDNFAMFNALAYIGALKSLSAVQLSRANWCHW